MSKKLREILNILESKKIPIKAHFENKDIDIGYIHLKFEDKEKIEKIEFPSVAEVFLKILSTLSLISEEINLKLEKHSKHSFRKPLLSLFFRIYNSRQKSDEFDYILSFDEESIFGLIKSKGPIALRQYRIQFFLDYWLKDKELANKKLQKLKDSLIEYASLQRKKDKEGRPPNLVIAKFGKEWIRDFYGDLLKTFNSIKDIDSKAEDWGENFAKEYKKITKKRREELIHKTNNWAKHARIYLSLPLLRERAVLFFKLNTDLINEFRPFMLGPYELAREFMARILGVSRSTVDKILPKK